MHLRGKTEGEIFYICLTFVLFIDHIMYTAAGEYQCYLAYKSNELGELEPQFIT